MLDKVGMIRVKTCYVGLKTSAGRKLQVSDSGDIGAHNFDFSPKFPQNGGFSVPNFVFLEDIFQQKGDFLKG